MFIVHAANAKQFEIPTAQFTSLATPSTGAKETALWKFTLKSNSDGLTHQLTREEIIVALSGAAVAVIGKDRHVIKTGDTIIVPPLVDFSLANPNSETFTAIAIMPVGGKAIVGHDEPFTPPWAA
jgi:quercetin dioxygenase-like cupin family protein